MCLQTFHFPEWLFWRLNKKECLKNDLLLCTNVVNRNLVCLDENIHANGCNSLNWNPNFVDKLRDVKYHDRINAPQYGRKKVLSFAACPFATDYSFSELCLFTGGFLDWDGLNFWGPSSSLPLLLHTHRDYLGSVLPICKHKFPLKRSTSHIQVNSNKTLHTLRTN